MNPNHGGLGVPSVAHVVHTVSEFAGLTTFGHRDVQSRHARRTTINPITWLATAVLSLVSPTEANAGITSATINRILIVESGDLVYVYPTGGVNNPPGCHGSNGNYYSFSLARPRAREYFAALLSAQARGAVVEFYGTGTCTDQSLSETLNYFTVVS